VITTAGRLPAEKVIHTVGPVWNGGSKSEAKKLASCYTESLKLAEKHDLRSIAFPNISTGIYSYPKQEAAEIAVKTAKEFDSDTIEEVIFVCFDDENFQLYHDLL